MSAQRSMQRLSDLKETTQTWRSLEDKARHLVELMDLAAEEGDQAMADSISQEVAPLAARLDDLELQLTLSGGYDHRNAILSIHAGTGGVDAQDWAQMLLRMYLRWAERRGYTARVVDSLPGEEEGLKNAVVLVHGRYAYGYLKAEKGVHRLVRLSAFDALHLRHTSFALVEVLPEAEDQAEVAINPDDLRVEFYRASGHGGQNVQKVATAVRITHVPTGIVASCQNERSQHQNREMAMTVLRARLLQIQLQKQAETLAKLKGEYVPAAWGNQIRSYVLHPYKLVKDHRTDVESTSPDAVLDGDLDTFIRAYLRSTVGAGG